MYLTVIFLAWIFMKSKPGIFLKSSTSSQNSRFSAHRLPGTGRMGAHSMIVRKLSVSPCKRKSYDDSGLTE